MEKRMATPFDMAIGGWLSAAQEDKTTCKEMLSDIEKWFDSLVWPEFPGSEWDWTLPVEDNWRPMKTAPKDGTDIYLLCKGWLHPVLAYFDMTVNQWRLCSAQQVTLEPSYWFPRCSAQNPFK